MVKALPIAELLTGYQGSLCLTSMDSDPWAPKVEHHMTRSKLFRELPPINMRHIKRRCLPHSMIPMTYVTMHKSAPPLALAALFRLAVDLPLATPCEILLNPTTATRMNQGIELYLIIDVD